jgi:hypothetical protein
MKYIQLLCSFLIVFSALDATGDELVATQPQVNSQQKQLPGFNKPLCCGAITGCTLGCCSFLNIFSIRTVAHKCLYYSSGNTVTGNFTGYHLETGILGKVLMGLKNCAPSSSFYKTAAVLVHLNPCGGTTGTCVCCIGLGCILCSYQFCSKRQDAPEPKND